MCSQQLFDTKRVNRSRPTLHVTNLFGVPDPSSTPSTRRPGRLEGIGLARAPSLRKTSRTKHYGISILTFTSWKQRSQEAGGGVDTCQIRNCLPRSRDG